jgi:hypothetical protein
MGMGIREKRVRMGREVGQMVKRRGNRKRERRELEKTRKG